MDFDMRDAEKLKQERRRLRKARDEELEEFKRLYGALDEEDKARLTGYTQAMVDSSDYRRDTEEPHIIEFKRAKINIKRLWLRNKREEFKLTQQQMADKLGITQQYYSLIENGGRRTDMDIPLLKRLSEIFGMTVEEIINEETPQ